MDTRVALTHTVGGSSSSFLPSVLDVGEFGRKRGEKKELLFRQQKMGIKAHLHCKKKIFHFTN